MNEKEIYEEECGFHMEEDSPNAHSLTREEIRQELEEKGRIAKIQIAIANKALLDGTFESIIKQNKLKREEELNKKNHTPIKISQKFVDAIKDAADQDRKRKENKVFYYKVGDSLITKIDKENEKVYLLDKETGTWRENHDLWLDYIYGELLGRVIDFDDIYPIGEPWVYEPGRALL